MMEFPSYLFEKFIIIKSKTYMYYVESDFRNNYYKIVFWKLKKLDWKILHSGVCFLEPSLMKFIVWFQKNQSH